MKQKISVAPKSATTATPHTTLRTDGYSHLKNFTVMALHTVVIKIITMTGAMTLPGARPSTEFFRIFIPCVKGMMSAIF